VIRWDKRDNSMQQRELYDVMPPDLELKRLLTVLMDFPR
jgi:hypothetical protein